MEDKITFVITDKIRELCKRLADMYRSELVGSIASGDLLDFDYVININGNYFSLVFKLQEYWQYVEYGRRAGKQPPIDVIEDWIRIKPIIPYPINGKVPDTRQLAFLIARHIGREGIEGKKYLTNVMYSNEANDIIDNIRQEFVYQVNDYLIKELKTLKET